MFQTKTVEKNKTHFVFSKLIFFFENSAFYEIMWKNIAKWGWPQMTKWRMRAKVTNRQSDYVTSIALPP